jgi:polyphosphate kinase
VTNSHYIKRDISWLAFNSRVLQEAADPAVPLRERVKFLGIFSNNMDEFFRVRVATLRRMLESGIKRKLYPEENPEVLLKNVQERVIEMQLQFEKIWRDIHRSLKKENIRFLNERQLTAAQKKFVLSYFDENVRSNIVPLMIQQQEHPPALNDKALYVACKLSSASQPGKPLYALVSVPSKHLPRFIELPAKGKSRFIILLEDVVKLALPRIFSLFRFDSISAHVIKLTRDAEIDIDNDLSTSLMSKIEKGLKKRKKGKPVRLVYDKDIDRDLLEYLIRKLQLSKKDSLIPGGRIHNFKDFMQFPDIITDASKRKSPFFRKELQAKSGIAATILTKDIMLHTPYHSFESIIDLLREAAMDPEVTSIKITCYRLASRSRVVNALINAARNGKKVTVMLELRARFDEEANLAWKTELEEEGVQVLIGNPKMKVHAKICIISKRSQGKLLQYGFVGTGNLNETTAKVYADHYLLTANKKIMADINRIFNFLERPQWNTEQLANCGTLIVSPVAMRKTMLAAIDGEIRNAKRQKEAEIWVKLNSLSDYELISKLEQAAREGVKVNLIIRGICCMKTENRKFKKPIRAVSIVDEYLEHARVMIFHNGGKEKTYLSSADWMIRNLDHRIEVACPIDNNQIQRELKKILEIQLQDNQKARILDNDLNNQYVNPRNSKKIRSQVAIHQYLLRQKP